MFSAKYVSVMSGCCGLTKTKFALKALNAAAPQVLALLEMPAADAGQAARCTFARAWLVRRAALPHSALQPCWCGPEPWQRCTAGFRPRQGDRRL